MCSCLTASHTNNFFIRTILVMPEVVPSDAIDGTVGSLNI